MKRGVRMQTMKWPGFLKTTGDAASFCPRIPAGVRVDTSNAVPTASRPSSPVKESSLNAAKYDSPQSLVETLKTTACESSLNAAKNRKSPIFGGDPISALRSESNGVRTLPPIIQKASTPSLRCGAEAF